MTDNLTQRKAFRVNAAIDARRCAADSIGRIYPGMALFILNRGQFSMIDAIRHCIGQMKNPAVSIWTWVAGEYDLENLQALLQGGLISYGRLIVDRSAEQRNVEMFDRWRAAFGDESIRISKNHAKMARVWDADRKVFLRGSMNLNHNPRFENLDISEGCRGFHLVQDIEESLPVMPRLCGNAEAHETLGNLSWDMGTLKPFQGVHVWKK